MGSSENARLLTEVEVAIASVSRFKMPPTSIAVLGEPGRKALPEGGKASEIPLKILWSGGSQWSSCLETARAHASRTLALQKV